LHADGVGQPAHGEVFEAVLVDQRERRRDDLVDAHRAPPPP
jgi:hypothetical protein